MTPWLKRDVAIVTHAPGTDVFRESLYLGVHIRRGDKIYMKEATYHDSEVKRSPITVVKRRLSVKNRRPDSEDSEDSTL